MYYHSNEQELPWQWDRVARPLLRLTPTGVSFLFSLHMSCNIRHSLFKLFIMTVSYLPIELWLIIQSFAKYSSNDLAALCLVCTDFYHAIVDSLYNSITVDSCDVCITLAECPGLAQKVKSFAFTYPRLIADDQSPKVNLGNLTLALKNMINLSTLKLIHSPQRYSSVLRHCYAELRIFHCTYCIDRQFLRFLNRQDNIRDLAVTCHYHWADDIQPKRFPRRSLPHLTQVSASYEWLRAFVPGRPVHTVRVKGESLLSRSMRQLPPIAILSRSTVPVRNLGIDLMAWPERSSTELCAEHAEEITLTGFAVRVSIYHSYFGLTT
jgi:hypothetical protein